jgi:hypothetical protein
MKNGTDTKRAEEASTFARWGKSIANVFKSKVSGRNIAKCASKLGIH